MMQRLMYLVIALLLPVSVMADERIIELNVTGQPPLNTDDQMGFMDEIAKEAFRRVGYKLKTVRLPAERGLVNANRGSVDGEMSRVKGIEKSYPNLIRVPEKIMDWEFVGFSYHPLDFEYGWHELDGKSVAYINGWKIFEKNVPDAAEITRIQNAEGLFNLLRRDRTDIILYERWGGHYLLHKMKMSGVEMCKQPLAVKEMYIYLHKKYRTLVPKLSAALVEMKKDGSYKRIFDKHLMPFKEHSNNIHDRHIEN